MLYDGCCWRGCPVTAPARTGATASRPHGPDLIGIWVLDFVGWDLGELLYL
jgi:hypothetical protein